MLTSNYHEHIFVHTLLNTHIHYTHSHTLVKNLMAYDNI